MFNNECWIINYNKLLFLPNRSVISVLQVHSFGYKIRILKLHLIAFFFPLVSFTLCPVIGCSDSVYITVFMLPLWRFNMRVLVSSPDKELISLQWKFMLQSLEAGTGSMWALLEKRYDSSCLQAAETFTLLTARCIPPTNTFKFGASYFPQMVTSFVEFIFFSILSHNNNRHSTDNISNDLDALEASNCCVISKGKLYHEIFWSASMLS